MKHTYVNWLVPAVSVAVTAVILGAGIRAEANTALQFEWRWFGIGIIIAIVITALVLAVILRRFTTIRASLYWFALLLAANIAFLSLTLAETLSATPQAAAFWQGLLPMAWIPIPVILLFFVLTFTKDSNMPFGIGAWTFTLAPVAGLLYFAGFTGLIELHRPFNDKLEYWGYQSEPGTYSSVVYGWMILLSLISLFELVRAYHRATNSTLRHQLRLFIFALSQYITIGIVFDLVIYSFNQDAAPPMAFVYTTTLSLIIGYGILRHGIFRISPAALSEPILQNLSEGILGLNADYTVEFANLGAIQIFGQSEETMRGRSLAVMFSEPDYRRLVNQSAGTGEPIVFEDIAAVGPNDRRVPVTITLSEIMDERGKLGGYILVAQNITELKHKSIQLAREKASVERRVLERTSELHDEQAKLNASIESLAVGFTLVDTNNKVIMQNHALNAMFELNEPLKSLTDLNNQLGDEIILTLLCRKAHAMGHTGVSQEIASGSRVFRVFAAPVSNKDGNEAIIGTILVIEDITEQKVRERSRDEFFSIASHELRTPLTAIKGNASMMLAYYADVLKDPDLKAMVQDMNESSTRLIEIVNDFLDLSGLEQGKISFDLSEHALEPVIESVMYEMKGIIRDKHLKLVADTMTLGTLPKVWIDENRTKQVVYNLVANAAKFTEHGEITISAKVKQDQIMVTVADSGRGIAVESRKLLFRKFQQAGNSLLTRDTTRGTGLGLYISKLIVEQMGGKIGLKSSVLGKGSTFYFTLPIATPEYMASHPAAHHASQTDTGLSS